MKVTREESKFRPVTIVIETQEELDVLKNIALVPNTVATTIRTYCSKGRAENIEKVLRNLFLSISECE